MVRKTSRETYHAIKAQGLLSNLRFRVYDIIYQHQPITISQMLRIAAKEVTNTGSFTGRISELERMGMIYCVYEGACPVTGRNVIFWGTTDNLPTKLDKPPTNKEIIENLQRQLRRIGETACSIGDDQRKLKQIAEIVESAIGEPMEIQKQTVEFETATGQGRLFT